MSNTEWWDETAGDWENLVKDSGYSIELNGSDAAPATFIGVVEDVLTRDVVDENTGEIRQVPQIIFRDRAGKQCNIFANYQIREAMESGKFVPGAIVKLQHFGKRDIGGGKTVNRMTIQVRQTTHKETTKK